MVKFNFYKILVKKNKTMLSIKRIHNVLLRLINNPVYFYFRLVSKIKSIFSLPHIKVKKRINGILFEFNLDKSPFVTESFLGNYEPKTVKVIKKILSSGDTFIDIGANIGYLSAIGSGFVGKTGAVHCFEPDPKYYQKLQKLPTMNPNYKIITKQYALGKTEGEAKMNIADLSKAGGNTLVSNFMKPTTIKENIQVTVKRLDNYIKEQQLKNIALIKIDVEGFEFPVLQGLENFFIETPLRPMILCEVTPNVYPLMEYQFKDLFDYMKKFGYSAFNLNDKKIHWSTLKKTANVLFKQ